MEFPARLRWVARGLADAPMAGRVGETPVASSPARDSVCGRLELVFFGESGSRLGSPVGSGRYGRIWSFAARRISALITPRKSAPCGLNWSFATCQGSCANGAEYAVVDATVAFWIWAAPLPDIGVLGWVGVEPGLNTPWITSGPAPPGSVPIM